MQSKLNFFVFKNSEPYPPQTYTTKTQDFKQPQTNKPKTNHLWLQ